MYYTFLELNLSKQKKQILKNKTQDMAGNLDKQTRTPVLHLKTGVCLRRQRLLKLLLFSESVLHKLNSDK